MKVKKESFIEAQQILDELFEAVTTGNSNRFEYVNRSNARHEHIAESLDKESGRGLVLIGAAYLEQLLEELIKANISLPSPKPRGIVDPLFETLGPLSNLSAKIRIAYVFDLIPKWMYDDLELVRKLRNHAAHSFGPYDFGNPEVTRFTERMMGANLAIEHFAKEKAAPFSPKQPSRRKKAHRTPPDKAEMEKMRTVLTISFIAGRLVVDIAVASATELPLALRLRIRDDKRLRVSITPTPTPKAATRSRKKRGMQREQKP